MLLREHEPEMISRVLRSLPVMLALVGLGPAGKAYAQSALPSPTPMPSVTATAAPTLAPEPPSPSPVPSVAPSPLPLRFERTRAQVVPGRTIVVRVTGGTGAIAVQPPGPNVDASFDPATGLLSLTGRVPGSTSVTLSDDAGESATLPVLVGPPGGSVPETLTVELGGTVSPDFVAAQIRSAVAEAAQLLPGASVDVRDARPPDVLHPGDTTDLTVRVAVAGGPTSVDTGGTTAIHLVVDSLAELDPQVLYYSDDPESLERGIAGVVYRNTLEFGKPARAYIYHISSNATHVLTLVLRAAGVAARVQILGGVAGPSDAFGYVGHLSTVRYLLARHSQESRIVTVSPDQPFALRLGAGALESGALVAGIFDARVLDGGPVDLAVVATTEGADPLALATQPELGGDGHGRRGEFDLATVPPLALAYAAGAPDPDPFTIGMPTIANLRSGGRALGGDYGALRAVALQLANPTAGPATLYLYEIPAGGSATSTFWFTGDTQPTEIPCVYREVRYAVRAFTLAPGETQTVTGEYMTDGTSSFPLRFGLTATPPAPPPGPYSPDACNPRTPPAT